MRTCFALRAAIALSFGAIATLLHLASASAQIVPDSSLPQNSMVSPNSNGLQNGFQIDGGTTAGTNLFHSFSEFSVPTGSEAFFNNAIAIENIFTRVTGNNLSNINGRIRANGMANLFLLNPNGIVFGSNARLDIGGSFFGTTADSIVFENGVAFGVAVPEASPLLTVNTPIGLQLSGNAGEIRVRGEGYSLTRADPRVPIARQNRDGGLQVKSGNTLALMGGNVRLEGGTLVAEGGRIELGSVGEGFVGLALSSSSNSPENDRWQFDYEGVSSFQDIQLLEESAVDVSGTGVGSMQFVGQQIALRDGSIALLQNQGTQAFGSLHVRASESVTLTGKTFAGAPENGAIEGGLRQDNFGTGNGGNIEISTRELTIRNGARIGASTQGGGNAGNINIRAESVSLVSSPLAQNGSTISNATFGRGAGGNISIATQDLSIREGGLIGSVTFGTGSGGNVLVNATGTVELTRTQPQVRSRSLGRSPSAITATSLGVGNAGSAIVNASRIVLRNGGLIRSAALASGDGGKILINATEFVEVSGTIPNLALVSQIDASAAVSAETFRQRFGLPPVPSGSPGSLTVNTPQLRVANGGQIAARNDGTGIGGNLEANVENIFLDSRGKITASTQSGGGGNIQLNLSGGLQLRNGSSIVAEAGGKGNGGNITIRAGTIALIENSNISANAVRGTGGNVAIATQGIFVSPDSAIAASSQFGVEGVVEITQPEIDTYAGLMELSDRIADPADEIGVGCPADEGSSFTRRGREVSLEDPTQPLVDRTLWQDWDDYSNSSIATISARPVPIAQAEDDTPLLVEANTWQMAADGTVALLVEVERSPDLESLTSCRSHISQR